MLILEETKYDKIKGDIKKNPKLREVDLAKKHFTSLSTISRIKNSKNYEDYREKYTSGPDSTYGRAIKKAMPKTSKKLAKTKKGSFWGKVKEFFT